MKKHKRNNYLKNVHTMKGHYKKLGFDLAAILDFSKIV